MESERTIDGRIAVEVMGWHLSRHGNFWNERSGDNARMCETWKPSTDVRDSFAVVEAMRAKGWEVNLNSEGATEWRAEFVDAHGCGFVSFADKLPMAVCRAALAATNGGPR